MKKSTVNENDSKIHAISCLSATSEPDLKGDRSNVFLLLLLYTLQGVPYGVSTALPIILQSKKVVSYEEQARLSLVLWPYSIKLLWAPIIDALYVRRIGRRKSWLIPVQYAMGICLIYIAHNINDWIPESGRPNFKMILYSFMVVNSLAATQDTIVDGWALTMLKKNNVSYASTSNGTGLALGMFIGSVFPILFASEEFCNKYLRITPHTGGIITLQGFLYFWGIIFMVITTLVGLLKKETNNGFENDHKKKISILQNYKIVWDILNLPTIRLLTIALLTARIGFSAMEAVSTLKFIDAGVSKDDITIIAMVIDILKIFVPLTITKFTSGPKPMNLYMMLTPIRILWSLTFVVLFYYTPKLIKNNGKEYTPLYYNIILGLISTVNEILYFVMLVATYAFFSRISDPRFGATYMTMLNTINSLGWAGPHTLALNLVDTLTFYKCSNNAQNSCFTIDLINTCNSDGGDCVIFVDGYYVEIALCVFIGFAWYFYFKNIMINMQSLNSSLWLVHMKPSKKDNSKPSFVITST